MISSSLDAVTAQFMYGKWKLVRVLSPEIQLVPRERPLIISVCSNRAFG